MGRVIVVNGYKAFRGVMRICVAGQETEEIYGNWLYDPKTDRWYSDYHVDYAANNCTIVGVAK